MQNRRNIEPEQIWHCDGHELNLRINRAELEVLSVLCPSEEKADAECKTPDGECGVRLFIYRFGMDCNGGICPAISKMGICWTIIGKMSDLESAQIWFMPTEDEIFQAWITANKTPLLDE